jgi:hypothetical protein
MPNPIHSIIAIFTVGAYGIRPLDATPPNDLPTPEIAPIGALSPSVTIGNLNRDGRHLGALHAPLRGGYCAGYKSALERHIQNYGFYFMTMN